MGDERSRETITKPFDEEPRYAALPFFGEKEVVAAKKVYRKVDRCKVVCYNRHRAIIAVWMQRFV